MAIPETVAPALTARQWKRRKKGTRTSPSAVWIDSDGDVCVDGSWPAVPPHQRHALAAFCLYGQPFGFTREDVRAVRLAVASGRVPFMEQLESLAARIEALLPPEEGTP